MASRAEEDASQNFRYLEGYVELRQGKEYQKLFCVLSAQNLSFYDQKKTARELERSKPLEQAQLIWKKTTFKPDELKLGIKHVVGANSELKLKFPTTEERDNWYIRLHAISHGVHPSDIQLLPGQIQIANDILDRENARKDRRPSAPEMGQEPPQPPPDPPGLIRRRFSDIPTSLPMSLDKDFYNLYPPAHPTTAAFPPTWYFGKIPRRHSEQILENNPKYGDLLVRASESTKGPGEFSLSVRQMSRDGAAIVRHYKLIRMNLGSGINGYKLDIDEAHTHRNSVYELLLFFIEKSGGTLRLFETQDSTKLKMPDNLYENRFSENPDSGELSPTGRLNSSFVRKSAPWQKEDDYLAPDVRPGHSQDGGYMEPSHKYENTTRVLRGPIRGDEQDGGYQMSHKYVNTAMGVRVAGQGPPKAMNGLPNIKEEGKEKSRGFGKRSLRK